MGNVVSPVFYNGIPVTNNQLTAAFASIAAQVQEGGNGVGSATLGSDGYVPWGQMKPEVQELPLAFVLPGKPAADAAFYLVMAMAVTLPVNLAGSVSYANVAPTSAATFTLSKISQGVTTVIGTLTLVAGSSTASTLSSQGAVSLAAGDVLKLQTPATTDATLSDVGITILAAKV